MDECSFYSRDENRKGQLRNTALSNSVTTKGIPFSQLTQKHGDIKCLLTIIIIIIIRKFIILYRALHDKLTYQITSAFFEVNKDYRKYWNICQISGKSHNRTKNSKT